MRISHQRVGATSIDTHTKPWFKRVWAKHSPRAESVGLQPMIVEPYARNCKWGTVTNDIDPNTEATHHADALDFLEMIADGVADCVIFDPPFSRRQAQEKYGSGHINVYSDPGYVKKCMMEIVRMLKPGGTLIKLGFNSTRHSPMLECTHLYVINSGGNHNDVLCSIWTLAQERLP